MQSRQVGTGHELRTRSGREGYGLPTCLQGQGLQHDIAGSPDTLPQRRLAGARCNLREGHAETRVLGGIHFREVARHHHQTAPGSACATYSLPPGTADHMSVSPENKSRHRSWFGFPGSCPQGCNSWNNASNHHG
eukprot:scaffold1782_cov414-Prasinococcus_capsulatus_cf.AAC.17